MIFSRMFCLTVPEKNEEESFSVSFNFGYGKNLCIRGVCDDNLSKIFMPHCAEKDVEVSLMFHWFQLSKNFMHWRGRSCFFAGNFLSHCAEKDCR